MRRPLLSVLVVLVALLASACSIFPSLDDAKSKPSSATSAAAKKPARVPTTVVLDASGSMKVEDAPGQRFAAAQAAVTSLAQTLTAGHPLGLMVYGTGTGNSPADKAAGCQDITQVVPVGPLDQTAYAAAVAQLKPSGYTPIGSALTKAAAALPTSGKRAIVLVSDGIDTCAPPAPCDVARGLHADDPDLSISTVGFRVDGDAQSQLQCIADAAGGIYLDATNGPLLASRLAALFDPDAVARSIQPAGYRGVELGMTAAEAAKAAGRSLGTVPSTGTVKIRYVDCTLVFQDGKVAEIQSTSKDVRTVDGVAPGDDVGTVVAAYGASYATPSTGVVQVTADAVAGTGFEFVYQPVAGSSAPAGPITTITLCTCAVPVEPPADQIPGQETGRVSIDHPTWGRVTVVSSFVETDYGYGVGHLTAFNTAGQVVWSSGQIGDPEHFQFEYWRLHTPATDPNGLVFVDWNPGRYNGVTTLKPVPDGFDDVGTLPDDENDGGYDVNFYYAEAQDVDGDGTLEVVGHVNDCVPDCAGGTITDTTYRWDGSAWVTS